MIIKVDGVYERVHDGIFRKVLRIVADPRFEEGQRVEFSYWNPAKPPPECFGGDFPLDTGSCGLKWFREFSVRKIDESVLKPNFDSNCCSECGHNPQFDSVTNICPISGSLCPNSRYWIGRS